MKIQLCVLFIEFHHQILCNLTKTSLLITLSHFFFISQYFSASELMYLFVSYVKYGVKKCRGLPPFPVGEIVFMFCKILTVCQKIVEEIIMKTFSVTKEFSLLQIHQFSIVQCN